MPSKVWIMALLSRELAPSPLSCKLCLWCRSKRSAASSRPAPEHFPRHNTGSMPPFDHSRCWSRQMLSEAPRRFNQARTDAKRPLSVLLSSSILIAAPGQYRHGRCL